MRQRIQDSPAPSANASQFGLHVTISTLYAFYPKAELKKLVIFGVGLIGGSVALAIKQHLPDLFITGVGRKDDPPLQALQLGVINLATDDAAHAVSDADMVLIATPVAQTAQIFQQIYPVLQAHTVVTDAGSTKSDIASYAAQFLAEKHCQFVGGHPIAGAEKSGIHAAQPDLFIGKKVVLTPEASTLPMALHQTEILWHQCGAEIHQMTAQAHDAIFAAVSHLPHLLAFTLVSALSSRKNANEFFDYAASGFRDFTRIAASSPEMWRDISLANRSALLGEIQAYQQQLQHLATLLEQQDGEALLEMFSVASQKRKLWGEAQHKNNACAATLNQDSQNTCNP